jgi:hypothetical protein
MQSVIKSYNGLATVAAQPAIAIPDSARSFALEVSIPSGAITAWSVALEGSLDGVNWTNLITHTANIGSTQWAVDKPCTFVRVNVTALTLNTAPSISAIVLAVP